MTSVERRPNAGACACAHVMGFDHVYPWKDGGALKKAKVSEKPVDVCVQSQ